MDSVITFTPSDVLVWCGAIITLAGAIGVIIKIVLAAWKPNADQNRRLDEIESRLSEYDRMFRNDNRRLQEIEEGNGVTMRAILALLSHGIDGNEIDTMRTARDELQNYLISR